MVEGLIRELEEEEEEEGGGGGGGGGEEEEEEEGSSDARHYVEGISIFCRWMEQT
jgi:hypothetical protein